MVRRQTKIVVAFLLALLFSLGVLFLGVSYSNTIRPVGIIIHHSAIPSVIGGPPIDEAIIDDIHRRRGFRVFYWGRFYHVGYHYIILPDGTVQQGRPEHCHGAHAEGYNSFIGICLVGNFSSTANPSGQAGPAQPTPAQLQALVDLCRQLREKYGFPVNRILRHSDVSQTTECPGDRFPFQEFLKAL
jgi:N-acetylmuramoyl-L-alanine amidase